MDLLKRSAAECIGTLILVFLGCGAVCIGADLLGIAIAFGLAVTVMIYAIGTISGCHINPAVSAALCAARKFPVKDTIAYCAAQFLGAALGAGLILLVMGMDALSISGLGMTAPAAGVSAFQAVLAEFIGTFILMLVIMGVAVDRRAPAGFAGIAIGGSVLAAILAVGAISGGSLNPARTFGPDLMALFFAGSDALWTTFPLYIAGPVLGAVCAALLYCRMAGRENC